MLNKNYEMKTNEEKIELYLLISLIKASFILYKILPRYYMISRDYNL